MLLFPRVSYSRDYVRYVKDEGFTDIAVGLAPDERKFTGQGYGSKEVLQLSEWAGDFGLGLIVFTGYMKYREDFLREHPERSMVLRGGTGDLRDSDNLRVAKWLCPFQPENKAEYLSLLARIVKLPPLREIHLNDEASIGFPNGSIGCYCEHCIAEYEREFGSPPPVQADWESEDWWRWIQHRMESWTAVHAYFREELKKLRPDVMVGIQYSSRVVTFADNPWRSGIDPSRDAEALDVLCTDPYHFQGASKFPYEPARRVLGEATRTLAGATVKRSTNIYPQAFMPPLTSQEMTHRDGFMAGAIPFALGAETITPYTFDLMHLIPGFYEGMVDARALIPYFEKTRPYALATVVNPSQSEIYGYPQQKWGREMLTRWPNTMHQVGLPWRWVFDRRLPDADDALSGTVVLPDTHCLTQEQRAVLDRHLEAGGGVLWVGRKPDGDWPGKGPCPPPEGETVASAELNPISRDHVIFEGAVEPIMLASTLGEPGICGETLAEVDGRPGLVIRERDGGREAWLAGIPVYGYVRPGDHGSVRAPTGGIALLRNLIRWAAGQEPVAELWPYPPANAYGDLRPWDRRDVPTMELFPMVGDGCLVCLIFNYLGLEYGTNLVMRTPGGTVPTSLVDIYTGEERLSAANVTDNMVSLPVEMAADREYLAVELSWQ